jgi:RNA polymerase sigma-70 factor, ECF subfamily
LRPIRIIDARQQRGYRECGELGTNKERLPDLLPRLRRYAVALTGSDRRADELVKAGVTRVNGHAPADGRLDVVLFGAIQGVWREQGGGQDAAAVVDGHDKELPVEFVPAASEVRRAVARLPMTQREALLLVCVEGFSYGEAANILQIPVEILANRLAASRMTLHRLMAAGHAAPNARVVRLGSKGNGYDG